MKIKAVKAQGDFFLGKIIKEKERMVGGILMPSHDEDTCEVEIISAGEDFANKDIVGKKAVVLSRYLFAVQDNIVAGNKKDIVGICDD